jgi:hypothetical protein
MIGTEFDCSCPVFTELAQAQSVKVGVDIERVKGAVLALTNLRFGTTLRFAVAQGQVSRDEQWVAAALNCEDYQKAIDIAIEGFISSVKVGDYDLHLEPNRESDA